MSEFYLQLEGIPPSVNHYKTRFRNGNTVVSKEALAFKQLIAYALHGKYAAGPRFEIILSITLGKKQKGDIDNFPKLVIDGLAEAGAFRSDKGDRVSDARVRHLEIFVNDRERPDVGLTEVYVKGTL